MSSKFPNIDEIPFFKDWKYNRGKPAIKIAGIKHKSQSFKEYVLENVKNVNEVQLLHSFICAGTRVIINYDPVSGAMGDNKPFIFVGFDYDWNIDGFFELSYKGATSMEKYLKRIQYVNDTFQQTVNLLSYIQTTAYRYSTARNRCVYNNHDLHVATIGGEVWHFNGNTFYTLSEDGAIAMPAKDSLTAARHMSLAAFRDTKSPRYFVNIESVMRWVENL